MNKEQIVTFAANIIENGVESNLSNQKIKEGLNSFTNYIKSQGYANNETLKILTQMEKNTEELVKIAQVFGLNGIASIFLTPSNERKKTSSIKESNYVTSSSCGFPSVDKVETDRCGNPVRTVKTDICGINRPIETDRCGNPIRNSGSRTRSRC